MDPDLFKELQTQGLIPDTAVQKVKALEEHRLFSLHWELRTILYLGITLLSGGLGVLVYKNIDTIGHQVILIFIALVTAGCFYYCVRTRPPFSRLQVPAPNSFFDYILLLGCLTFITFIGYLQFEYAFFGEAYGLATFIPLIVLFFSAYYFDHLGVLSLAITNLAAWAGIAITPLRILRDNDFDKDRIIYTGLALGVLLILLGLTSDRRNFKKHFELTYANFGTNMLFIATLAGLFPQDKIYGLWFLLELVLAYFFYRLAVKRNSFYFLLIITLYTYIALSYVVVRILWVLVDKSSDAAPIYLGLLYFILSAIGLIRLLMYFNKKIKTHDSL
ncbi:MAG TPA: DUF2157 domain-containing protein [Puia sp.]|nr:DUF2157 domain-containing protein [Puia sp.]